MKLAGFLIAMALISAVSAYSQDKTTETKPAVQSSTSKTPSPPTTPTSTKGETKMATPAKPMDPKTIKELVREDLKVGSGTEAKAGNKVTVHYTGWLTNNTKFDSSKDRGQPFTFQLGSGSVIAGWEKGVAGMKVGGVRKLTIPPDMGYGSRGVGSIPPNSVLVFEVELLDVK